MSVLVTLLTSASLSATPAVSAADFAFLRVGLTTPQVAIRDRGNPDLDYPAWVVEGRIDWFIGPVSEHVVDEAAGDAMRLGKKLKEVRVFEYCDPDNVSVTARLVFADGKLWYAILPLGPSETTLEKIEARYGRAPDVQAAPHKHARVFSYPLEGFAYVEAPRLDRIGWKVIIPPAEPR